LKNDTPKVLEDSMTQHESNSLKALKIARKAFKEAEKCGPSCYENFIHLMSAMRGPDFSENAGSIKQEATAVIRQVLLEGRTTDAGLVVSDLSYEELLGKVKELQYFNLSQDQSHFNTHIQLAADVIVFASPSREELSE